VERLLLFFYSRKGGKPGGGVVSSISNGRCIRRVRPSGERRFVLNMRPAENSQPQSALRMRGVIAKPGRFALDRMMEESPCESAHLSSFPT
jgi:hypothetical protein